MSSKLSMPIGQQQSSRDFSAMNKIRNAILAESELGAARDASIQSVAGTVNVNAGNIIANAAALLAHKSSSDHDSRYYTQAQIDDMLGSWVLTSSLTVNFDNTMTSAEMQAVIDALPQTIARGVTLKFQFANGSYTMSSTLSFGFGGPGIVRVWGNSSDNTLSTSKSVTLDFSGADCSGVVNTCTCQSEVNYLEIIVNTSSAWRPALQISQTPYSSSSANSLVGTSTSYGMGLYAVSCMHMASLTYIGRCNRAIWAINMATLFSNGNDDNPSYQPSYGLYCARSIIYKNGTQPAGSVANETITAGGQIW